MHDEATLKFFARYGKAAPTHQPHGTSEDITKNMKRLQPKTWRLEGNRLIGQTDMGELVQNIPTDYILTGTDDDGLPVFTKVKLQ